MRERGGIREGIRKIEERMRGDLGRNCEREGENKTERQTSRGRITG